MKKKLIANGMLACIAFLLSGCGFAFVRGSGYIVTQERTASGFSRVELTGSGDVILTQNESEGVLVEADDNIMKYIETEVRGDTLYLGMKENLEISVLPSRSIKFHVHIQDVEELTISGSGELHTGELKAENLRLNINGSGGIRTGKVEADRITTNIVGSGDIFVEALTARSIESLISGSGTCRLSGKVDSQTVEIIGSGDYSARDLESQSASVRISGAGDVSVRVSAQLNAVVTGSGNVVYYGQPHVNQRITGSGNVTGKGS